LLPEGVTRMEVAAGLLVLLCCVLPLLLLFFLGSGDR